MISERIFQSYLAKNIIFKKIFLNSWKNVKKLKGVEF